MPQKSAENYQKQKKNLKKYSKQKVLITMQAYTLYFEI